MAPETGMREFTCSGCGRSFPYGGQYAPPRCPNCGAIFKSTLTSSGKKKFHTFRTMKEIGKEEIHRRSLDLFSSKISGSGSSSKSSNGGGSKVSSSNLILLLFIILIISFIYGVIISPGLESGFWQTKMGSPIKNMLEKTRGAFGFFGNQFSMISRILKGEEVWSFNSGGSEIQKKTGISFGELNDFGKYYDEEFGINGEITIGILDENLKILPDVKLSCEIEDVSKGKIDLQDAKISEGVAEFDIYNPAPYSEMRVPFYCSFDDGKKPESKLAVSFASAKAMDTKKIKLSLEYPLKITSKLEIFGMPYTVYRQYLGRPDAFDKLENGLYKNYNPEIKSKTTYISDVDVSMWFDKQPLGVKSEDGIGGDYTFRFGFKNKNTKNKLTADGFRIKFPIGMKVIQDECEALSANGDYWILNKDYLKSIGDLLSDKDGTGESEFFSCKVKANRELLGGSSSAIVKAGDIESDFDYTYTILAEKDKVLRKKTEVQKPVGV